MIDPDLERRTSDCTELMEAWRELIDMINRGIKSPEAITPQSEQAFLAIKARIAMLHDSFMDSLKHDKNVGTNMLEIVNRSITLRIVSRNSEAEAKKLEQEWHECFLLLNETISTLNEERTRLSEINEFTHGLKKAQERFMVNLKAFFNSIYFKGGVTIAVIAFIVWGVPALGIYQWDDLREDVPFTRPMVKFVYDTSRGVLGFDAAYLEFPDFVRPLDEELRKVPGVSEVEDGMDQTPKDRAAARLPQRMRFDDTARAEELLNSASNYNLKIVSSNSGRASVFSFFYDKVSEARQIATMIDLLDGTGSLPDDYDAYRKANVLIIIQSTDDNWRRSVAEVGITPLAPAGLDL